MLEFFLLDSISDMRAIDDDTSSTVENNMVHALGNIEITALIYKKWKEKREEIKKDVPYKGMERKNLWRLVEMAGLAML